MKLTILQMSLEGTIDTDHTPQAFEGHLTLEQATELARQCGSGYPYCACVACDEDEEAAFYANFANEEKPPMNDDGTVESSSQAHLEVWFHHTESSERAVLN